MILFTRSPPPPGTRDNVRARCPRAPHTNTTKLASDGGAALFPSHGRLCLRTPLPLGWLRAPALGKTRGGSARGVGRIDRRSGSWRVCGLRPRGSCGDVRSSGSWSWRASCDVSCGLPRGLSFNYSFVVSAGGRCVQVSARGRWVAGGQQAVCVVGKAAGGVASCGQMRARGAEAVVACTRLRAWRTFRFRRGKLTLTRCKP